MLGLHRSVIILVGMVEACFAWYFGPSHNSQKTAPMRTLTMFASLSVLEAKCQKCKEERNLKQIASKPENPENHSFTCFFGSSSMLVKGALSFEVVATDGLPAGCKALSFSGVLVLPTWYVADIIIIIIVERKACIGSLPGSAGSNPEVPSKQVDWRMTARRKLWPSLWPNLLA
eukprot:1982671-Amphidinium_carterae.1